MRAAVYTEYGPPSVVRITEVPVPVPGPRDLLVRVHASTVTRTDAAARAGTPAVLRLFTGLRRPRATILGCEFAGEVEAVGPEVTSYTVGDRVFGYQEGAYGGHAEYMTVREDRMLSTIPEGWSYAEAAPATEGSHYALSFIRRAKIRAGQDVLVHGATGAIGSAAVQLLAGMGAHVTATARGEHADLVRGLGAERVIDYTTEDFTRGEARYDVVLDAVGKSSFRRSRRVLRPGGIYSSSEPGRFWHNVPLALVSLLLPRSRRRVVFPLPIEDASLAAHFRGLMEAGTFRPLVDRAYPLERIVEAYECVATGQKVGSVVITLD